MEIKRPLQYMQVNPIEEDRVNETGQLSFLLIVSSIDDILNLQT